MKCSRLVTASLTLAFCLAAQGVLAQTPLNLIGGADSGATFSTNGDLEELVAFTVPNVNVNFTAAGGGQYSESGATATGGNSDIVAGAAPDRSFPAGLGGTIDEAFLALNNVAVEDVVRVAIQNPLDFAFATIPGFTLRREGDHGGGSDVFGFLTSTGTLLDGTISAAGNAGQFSLSTSESIDLGVNVGGDTTFSLTYDIAVDGTGGDEPIDFTPTLSIGGTAVAVTSTEINPIEEGDDVSGFASVAGTSTVRGTSDVDIRARVSQTFTVASDLFSSQLDLSIFFGESTIVGSGFDRGALDNIVLTGELFESATLFGDFDGSGAVNASDFTVFRDSVGGDDSLINGAGVNDGLVNNLDFDVFAANFGQPGSANSVASVTAVPEPASLVALFAGAVMAVAATRRR